MNFITQRLAQRKAAERNLRFAHSPKGMIKNYHFTGKEPLNETIVEALNQKPKILERKSIVKRVTEKLMSLVRVFDDNMGDV